MLLNVVYALLIVFLLSIGAVEIGYSINNRYVAHVVVVAGAATAFFFYVVSGLTTGSVMANQGDEESISVGGFGLKAEARGKRLVSDAIGSRTLTNTLIIIVGFGLAFGGWLHHSFTEELARKTLAAMEENNKAMNEANYLSTQTEAQRLEIGKRIAMPKSLADKMRPRDP